MIYNRHQQRVWLDGHLSKPLKIARGVCQGCVMSPLLFDLVVEILGIMVRENG